MILELSRPPYAIGSRRLGCTDVDAVFHADQPFVLLREVTQAEWIQWCRSQGMTPRVIKQQIARTGKSRYFEVQSD